MNGKPPTIADVARVLALIEELEEFFPQCALDIEFAFAGARDELFLLQTRPLVMPAPRICTAAHAASPSRSRASTHRHFSSRW